MISPDIMTMPAAGQDFYGKTAEEMIAGSAVDREGNVTGTFHYVSGYTGFNESVKKEQDGYYFPFHLTKKGSEMTFKKNGKIVKENIPWEADNVFKVTAGDAFTILVDNKEIVTLKFDKAVFEPKE